MKFLNMYFFGEERPSLHDLVWFYGSISFMLFIFIFVSILNIIW